MSNLRKLGWIAVGYILSVVVGLVAVGLNEALMPEDVSQGSPGMVAFGDAILFIFVAGLFSLAPTWFLLKLWVAAAPRILLAAVLLIGALGPVSWLAVTVMAMTTAPGGPSSLPDWPQTVVNLVGLLIAFGAIPRLILGPVLLVIEGLTFFLLRDSVLKVQQ